MPVLVLNVGSSTLKADVLDPATGQRRASARAERVGQDGATLRLDDGPPTPVDAPDHAAVLALCLPHLLAPGAVDGVGHRVAHGGERFTGPALIDAEVVAALEGIAPLAPLHVPPALAAIHAARAALPDLPHVAVFDTSFHATLPHRAQAYAIDATLAKAHGVRRYGFHGTSHAWVARQAAAALKTDLRQLRLITCHLGSGASVTAIENGRSVETSMGMTPLEGLVMGTRCGDLDPGVVLHLLRSGMTVDEVDVLLNKRSGLAGLSGTSGDLRDIEERAAAGDEGCRTALQVFAHRLRKHIGAMAAVMGGVDAIIFTAGIGENSANVRQRATQRLEFLGAVVDEDLNRDLRLTDAQPVAAFHAPHSRVSLLAIRTDEARAIAEATASLVAARAVLQPRTIPIAVSARHVHLTQAAVEALFGPGHTLTPRNPLSQPGQYACEETVDVVGPKRTIERVRVLGPIRPGCQVEVSRTDEFFLGLDAPVRASGDTKSTPGVTLRGPAGSLTLHEGVICAWRHIHMHPDDAAAFGVKDKDVVEVEVTGGPRRLSFGDVLVRVHPEFRLEMHVDTDEANAAELEPGAEGALASTAGEAHLLRRSPHYEAFRATPGA
jgi:acetate kinase